MGKPTTALIAVEYDHSIDLRQIKFDWKVDGTNLKIKLRGKTNGWVGIGFNPTKSMKDANIIIGYVEEGTVKISDDFGTSYLAHKADISLGGRSNLSDISGYEKDGFTTLEFAIPLSSADKKDNFISVKDLTKIIVAKGDRDSFYLGHNFHSTINVNLTTGKYSY